MSRAPNPDGPESLVVRRGTLQMHVDTGFFFRASKQRAIPLIHTSACDVAGACVLLPSSDCVQVQGCAGFWTVWSRGFPRGDTSAWHLSWLRFVYPELKPQIANQGHTLAQVRICRFRV